MITRKKILVEAPHIVIESTDQFDNSSVGPFEVIVKTIYSHISAGTELACIAGMESFFKIPDTPGYTAIGEILQTGSMVSHLSKGDVVYTFGPHASHFKIDLSDRWHGICVKIPKGINLEHAAFTHMAGIALTAVRNSNIELGDSVLVTGLGTIGNLAAQLCQLQGANVIATDISNIRISIAQSCNIQETFNPNEVSFEKVIKLKTDDQLVSTYIDASGVPAVINQAIDFVALNGETILLGSPRMPFETNMTKFLQHHHLLPWNHTLKGALEFTYPTFQNDFNKHSIERNSKIIMGLIKNEKIIIKPLYSHKIKPKDAHAAYEGLKNNPDEYIGVVIDWN